MRAMSGARVPTAARWVSSASAYMKPTPDQGPLESLGTHRRVPEKKDAG
jgi:hypothetical protein